MAKQTAITLVTPTNRDIQSLAPVELFQNLKFWNKLTAKEQGVVVVEGQELAKAMFLGGMSDLAKGQHLAALHATLGPKNLFVKFIKQFTRYSPKQAYRYIHGYHNASGRLSEPVIRVASARNIRIFSDNPEKPFGVYTDAIRQLAGGTSGKIGPGPNASVETVERFLDQVEDYTKKRRSAIRTSRTKKVEDVEAVDPEEAQKMCYRFVVKMMKRLNLSPKKRTEWLETHFGLLLASTGVSGIRVSSVAVPEEFKPVPVGRPAQGTVLVANAK